jgi:hypothetical protein
MVVLLIEDLNQFLLSNATSQAAWSLEGESGSGWHVESTEASFKKSLVDENLLADLNLLLEVC